MRKEYDTEEHFAVGAVGKLGYHKEFSLMVTTVMLQEWIQHAWPAGGHSPYREKLITNALPTLVWLTAITAGSLGQVSWQCRASCYHCDDFRDSHQA